MDRFKKMFGKKKEESVLPKRDVTLAEVKTAAHEFEKRLPKGANRTVLLDADLRLDMEQLAPFLGARTDQVFYMSQETFAILEEKDRELAYELDHVQVALDRYFEKKRKLPLKPFTKNMQIDLSTLQQEGFLRELPQRPYYLVDETLIVSLEPKGA